MINPKAKPEDIIKQQEKVLKDSHATVAESNRLLAYSDVIIQLVASNERANTKYWDEHKK